MTEIRQEITVDLDQGSARSTGDALKRALDAALDGLGAKIAREFTSEFKRGSRGLDDIGDNLFSKLRGDAREATRAAGRSFEQLEDDLEGLRREAIATERAFRDLGLPPGLAAGFQVQARNITRLMSELRNSQHDFINDKGVGDYFREQGLDTRRAFLQTSAHLGQVLDSISKDTRNAANRDVATERTRTAQINAERGRTVATLQQETTRIRAENRVQEAEIRSSSQRRNRIFQAAAREFFAIQRGMGKVAAATARTIGSAFRGTGTAISRSFAGLGRIFSRQNTQMTAGLDGALDRRESILRSSFRSQERIVATSMITQSRQLDRFERQASRGIAGAVTGRSGLGAILGGGLAIGGGFALGSQLSRLATVGADFTQGMAVLDAQLDLTDKQMDKVRQTSLNLGNDLTLPGVSALDAAQGIQILTKQFGSLGPGAVKAAQVAAKGVLQLSRATKSSAEEAAGVVGGAVNVFGVEADRAVFVADQVAGALKNAAGVGFGDFALAFKQGATVFDQFQTPVLGAEGALTEFNTALAVMARGGLVGSDAGTSLKQFFLQANRAAVPAKEALDEVAERAGVVGSVFFDQKGNSRALTDALEILRGGLEGMSDQQKTSTLQTIFGSDAMRAASVLLKSTGPEYEKIRKSISEQGLAARIAAAQNTGLRGAMDALSSVIETQAILAYEKFQGVAGRVLLSFTELIGKVFSASGAFATFRTVIKGAALGLGALLVAKTAGEAIQFLGLAARALLTPFGLLALTFAGAGIAFQVLSQRSPELREAFGRIGAAIGRLLRSGLDLLVRGFENFAALMDRTVIPALTSAAEWVESRIGPAFESVSDFVTEKALPALQDFASSIRETVVPAAQEAWAWLNDRLAPAFDTVATFVEDMWARVSPILTPVGKAFADLGKAIADFATGGSPFSAVTDALGDVGSRLLDFGSIVVDGIRNLAVDAFGALRDVVGGIDWAEVGFSVLDAIEEIGFQIANILTDPIVLGIVASMAAALATAAVRLVQGLARGIIDNLGELSNILGPALQDALGEAFEFALSNTQLLASIIGAAFVSILAGSSLLRAFRGFGTKGAQEIGKGITSELPRAVSGPLQRQGGFLTGLFGSPATMQAQIGRDLGRINRQIETEVGRMQRSLTRAGVTLPAVKFGKDGAVDNRTLHRDLGRLQADLDAQVGPARAAGLRVRNAFLDWRKGADTFGNFARTAASSARAAGQSIGNTMAVGIGSALGGFMAGRSGSAGFSIASILGAGATGFAVGGPALAAFSAGIAGIGAAFGASQAAAAAAKAEVKEYTDALIEAGSTQLPELTFATAFGENLRDESVNVQKFFLETGVSFEELGRRLSDPNAVPSQVFGDLLVDMAGSREEAERLAEMAKDGFSLGDAQAVASNLGGQFDGVNQRLAAIGISGSDLHDILDAVNDEGSEFREGLENLPTALGITEELARTEEKAKGLSEATKTASQDLADLHAEREARAQEQIDELKGRLDEAGLAADAAREKLRLLVEGIFVESAAAAVDNLTQTVSNISFKGLAAPDTAVGGAQRRDQIRQFETDTEQAISAGIAEGVDKGLSVADIQAKLKEDLSQGLQAIDENTEIGDKLKGQLRDKLKAAYEEASGTEITAAIREVTGADKAADRAKRQIEEQIGSLEGDVKFNADFRELNTEIANMDPGPAQDAARTIADVMAVTIGQQRGKINTAARGLSDQIGISFADVDVRPAAQKAGSQLATGINASSGAARKAGQNLAEQVGTAAAAVDLAPTGRKAGGGFAEGMAATSGDAASAGGELTQAGFAAMILGGLQALFAGTTTGKAFGTGVGSQTAAASAAGSSLSSSASSGAAGGSLYSAGYNLAASMASGLFGGAGSVYSAASAIANNAAAVIRSALQIASPSKVTTLIGQQFSEGFALGIARSLSRVVNAASGMAQGAVDAIEGIVAQRAGLFDEIFRSGGGIGARSSLQGSLDDMVRVIREIEADIAERNRTRAEEGLPALRVPDPSFGIGTSRGRENLANITASVDAAKDILASMVEAGKSTKQIRREFKDLRGDIVRAAQAAGFTMEEINRTLGALDFSTRDLGRFANQIRAGDRRVLFQQFTDTYGSLIEGLLDQSGRGSSNAQLTKLIIRQLREAGVSNSVLRAFRGDIRAFVGDWRRDPARRAQNQLDQRERELNVPTITDRIGDEIRSFVEANRGLSVGEATRQLVALARASGIRVSRGDFGEIRDFVRGIRNNRIDRFNRALERAANAAETETLAQRLADPIRSFIEANKDLGVGEATREVVALARSVGITVSRADFGSIEELIRGIRNNRIGKFNDALDAATEALAPDQTFIDEFSGQFDQIIDKFSDTPGKIDDEIQKALRAAGLGREGNKYADAINAYIRRILDDPGRKLDEYLDKLLETAEETDSQDSFSPVLNIYPPSGDPRAQALVIMNQLAGARPRGY